MWEVIGTLFSAASGGGIIGAIGGFVSKFLEHQQQVAAAQIDLEKYKVQVSHEQAMAEKANETLKIEVQANLQQAGVEAASTFDKASFDALKSSYENDKATYATGDTAKNSGWFILVDVLRGVTRPLLTWGLDFSVMIIAGYLLYVFSGQLPVLAQQQGVDLLTYIVHSIIFLASTATTYWFASRTSSQASTQNALIKK